MRRVAVEVYLEGGETPESIAIALDLTTKELMEYNPRLIQVLNSIERTGNYKTAKLNVRVVRDMPEFTFHLASW